MRIANRLTLSFALSATLAVLLAAYFFFRTSSDVVERQYRDALRDTGAMLLPSALQWCRLPESLADSAMDVVASGLAIRVTLVAPDGRVLADNQRSGTELHDMEGHGTRPEVMEALQLGYGTDTRVSATLGVSFLYSALAVVDEGQTVGVLRLAVRLAGVEELKGLRLRYLGSGFVAVLAASLLLAAVLRTWFLRPMARLQQAASAIAGGDHHAPIGNLGRNEIGELGGAVQGIAEALRRTIRRLEAERFMEEAVFGSLQEGVIALGPKGFVILANQAAQSLLGESMSLHGRDVFEFFRQPQVTSLLSDLLQRQRGGECEISLDGPVSRVLRLSALHVTEKAGGLAGLLVLTDVTTQVATLRMRRDFFSNASHELRTPLTSILGYLEAMEDDLPAGSPVRAQYLDVLQRQAERMRRIIDDLLLLSRVESEQWPVQPERYDLVNQTSTLLESFQPSARKNEQVLVSNHPVPQLWVRADREKINVVISNLLDNALKYSGRGCRVELTLAPGDSWVEVAVADNGPGIPRDQKQRIFERFYRVDKSRSRQLGGTGLGLAIVRHILAAHDIEIEVETDLGEGARFSFRLPIEPA